MSEMFMDDIEDYVPILPDDWWESRTGGSAEKKAIESLRAENAKLRDMCSELYRRYWDVEGDLFIDPEMGELEEKLRELGIETWETWE